MKLKAQAKFFIVQSESWGNPSKPSVYRYVLYLVYRYLLPNGAKVSNSYFSARCPFRRNFPEEDVTFWAQRNHLFSHKPLKCLQQGFKSELFLAWCMILGVNSFSIQLQIWKSGDTCLPKADPNANPMGKTLP